MISQVSAGIRISVETFYQPDHSSVTRQEFMFAYRISIENNNPFPVQLMRRYWMIIDAYGQTREVEGDGVVGVQPVIPPGQQYQYISSCNFPTELGRMRGLYQLKNLNTERVFEAVIPAFDIVVPGKLN